MCEKAKAKKVSRPKIRALLRQLRDLGVQGVVNAGGEIWLSIEGQSEKETINQAVSLLIAEAPK